MSQSGCGRLFSAARGTLLLLTAACFSGCGGVVGSALGTNNATTLTGNWQFSATASTGQPIFSNFAGFIKEANDGAGDLTSVFQVQPDACFLGGTTLPASGTSSSSGSGSDATNVSLSSFSVNGQYVYLTMTASMDTQLSGTYRVAGGCANGGTGTVAGTRYAPLTGTYTGILGSTGQTAALLLTQGMLGNGNGYSPATGSAMFAGVSCFSEATVDQNGGWVIGSAMQLNLTAVDGESVSITGSFDPQAQAITVASATISGGACSGSLGGGVLAKTS